MRKRTTDASSPARKSVAYKSDVSEGVHMQKAFHFVS